MPAPTASRSNDAVRTSTAAGLTAYTIAKIVEDPRSAGRDTALRRKVEEALRRDWTIAKVAALRTSEIVSWLERYGVAFEIGEFESLARGRDSAWSIAETWLAGIDASLSATEEDFLGLAACELWKRLLPERPSIEMLDDWMQEGYDLVERREEPAACDRWWTVWSTLRSRFTPEMTTVHATEPVFSGMQSIFNWTQDFETALLNAGRQGRRHAEMGRDFCAQWAAQFRDEEAWAQVSFRRGLAEHLARLGEVSAAEAVYRELPERWPGNVWAWVALADVRSGLFSRSAGLHLDFEEARACLRRALALPRLRPEEREMLRDRMVKVEERALESPA